MRGPHAIGRAGAAVLVFIGWLAGSPGRAGEASGPSLAAIQVAYESAKSEAGGVHDDGLVIRAADCQQDRPGAYSCQITFTASGGAAGRLYFDVIGIDRRPAGWTLVSGLCKRHD